MSSELMRIEKKIDTKFDDLNKILLMFQQQVTTHRVQIENCENDKDDLKETLYGNGNDGLVLTVDRIKTTLKTTGLLKKSMWTNIGVIFICVGVITSVIFSVMASNGFKKDHFKKDNKQLEKRIIQLENESNKVKK
jgi:hypothetical protein